jgi:hypothetical protein
MITTRYLGAAAVAIFVIGIAAGNALRGSAKPDADYKMTVFASEAAARTVRGQNHRAREQSVNVAIDVMAPAAARAPQTGDSAN